jgi:DNA-binding CsgD family transcriptional regulator
MYTHFYWYLDNNNRILDHGRHRGNSHYEAKCAYHNDLKRKRRMRQWCNAAQRTETCSLRTAVLSTNAEQPFDDLFILACSQSKFTDTEIDVAVLLKQGKSNKEIQELFGIGKDGVESHLKNIYSKLIVHSRSEAVAKLQSMSDSYRFPQEKG